ncbi:hypothetical protein [Hydrogenimonas sp.]
MRKPLLLLPLSLLSVWGEQKELSDSQLAELYRTHLKDPHGR